MDTHKIYIFAKKAKVFLKLHLFTKNVTIIA